MVAQSGGIDDLIITYKGESVKDLTLTEFFFWNDSDKTLHDRNLDVGEGEYLRIEVSDKKTGRIFREPQLYARPENGVKMSLSDDREQSMVEIPITFKYLNSGEGWAIALRHTGEVRLVGAFRDAAKLKLKERPSGIGVFLAFALALGFVLADFMYLALAAAVVLPFLMYLQKKNPAPAKFRKFLASEKLFLPFP